MDWVLHTASRMERACSKCGPTGLHGPLFMDPCEAMNEDVSNCREHMESSLAKRLSVPRVNRIESEAKPATDEEWAAQSGAEEASEREADNELVVVETEGHTLSSSAVSWLPGILSRAWVGETGKPAATAGERPPSERAQTMGPALSASAASWMPVIQSSEARKLPGHILTLSPIWVMAKSTVKKRRRRREKATAGRHKVVAEMEPIGSTSAEHAIKVAATVRQAISDAVLHYPRVVRSKRKGIVVEKSAVGALMDMVERGRLATKRDLAHAAECLVEAFTTHSEPTVKSAAEKWGRYNNSRLPFAQDRDEVSEHLNANDSCLSSHPGLYKKRDKCALPDGIVRRSKQCKKKKARPMKKLAAEARPRRSRKAYCVDMARRAKSKPASERASLVLPWSSSYRLDKKSLAKLDMCLCTSLDYLDPMSRFLIEGGGARRVQEVRKSVVHSSQHNLPPPPYPASATPLPHNQSGRF